MRYAFIKALISTFLMASFVFIVYQRLTKENPWQSLAYNDLQIIYSTIKKSHPGPVDKENPEFNNWLHRGYALSKEKIGEIFSFDGYKFALSYFIAGFDDAHLALDFDVEKKYVLWPGFLLTYKNNKFFVDFVSDEKRFKGHVPTKNAELIACNGTSPENYMIENIFPYYSGVESVEAHWSLLCPYLLIDEGNPWRKKVNRCTFKIEKDIFEVDLDWQAIAIEKLKQRIKTDKAIEKREASIISFGKDDIWIALPTFNPKTNNEIDALKTVIAQAKELRDKDIIVFDLRGNNGGYGSWGTDLLQNIFGSEFMDGILSPKMYRKKDWRVSARNLANIERMLGLVEKQFGIYSDDYIYLNKLADSMKKQLKSGGHFAEVNEELPESKDVENPVKAGIFVVTDYHVFSAALTFLDYLKEIPGVIQIGLPTNADTAYLGTGFVQLPSGIAELRYPTSVERARKRKNNQSYKPDYRYLDINNTKALQKFILELKK